MPQPEHDPYDVYNDVPSLIEGAPEKPAEKPAANSEPDSTSAPSADKDKDSAPAAAAPAAKADAAAAKTGTASSTDAASTAGTASKIGSASTTGAASTSSTASTTSAASTSGTASTSSTTSAPVAKSRLAPDPYDDIYDSDPEDTEGEAQDNFVESKEPSELLMCLILASAYLGLAKYCWTPLLLAKDWKLLFNIEGFFLCIAVLAILIGLRPYMTPSALQVSKHGIKYRGPYWPQRKTVNWSQVSKLYLSPELIVALYRPSQADKKASRFSHPFFTLRLWPLIIPIVYLSDRERIAKVFIKYSPIEPVILSSPALISRVFVLISFLGVIIFVLEMLIQ